MFWLGIFCLVEFWLAGLSVVFIPFWEWWWLGFLFLKRMRFVFWLLDFPFASGLTTVLVKQGYH